MITYNIVYQIQMIETKIHLQFDSIDFFFPLESKGLFGHV